MSIDAYFILAKSTDHAIRTRLARCPDTPSEVLEILAKDPILSVRVAVAGNRNITTDIRKILEVDSSECVRAALRKNPRAS